MAEHPEAERIRRFLADLSERGPDVLPAYFEPGVVWHVGRGNPGSGTFQGLDGLIEYLKVNRTSSIEQLDVTSVTVLAGDSVGALFVNVEMRGGGTKVDLLLPQLFKLGAGELWDEYWILESAQKAPPLPEAGSDVDPSEFFEQYWYYSIELKPGQFTPGQNHLNLGLTRSLLERCEVGGRRCLDIGTMEAAVPVLLSRRGAGEVVAVDVMNCDRKVAVVKHFTGTAFAYHGGLTHDRTAPFLRRRYGGNFDLVVLSGVLYHCFSPLQVLTMARSLVRTGGLMIVETFTALDKQEAMFFNARGQMSPDPSTYFLVSVTLLEYLLRYLKLEPLDCVASPAVDVAGRPSARVAVVCRATNGQPAGNDPWMAAGPGQVDYRSLADWEAIDSSGVNPPAYGTPQSRFVSAAGACEVARTVFESPPLDLPERVAKVALDDLY